MSLKRIVDMTALSIKEFRDPYYQGFAAQLAFYFMLSVVPIVLIISQFLAFFSISLDFISEFLSKNLIGGAANFLMDMINSSPKGSINLVLIIIALWAASKAQYALNRIANYMSNDAYGKGFFKERFRAVVNILITLLTISVALVVLVYGRPIIKLVLDILFTNQVAKAQISRLLLKLRWPIMLLLYFFMISFNYYVLPTRRVKYKEVLPGSIFAAIGMLVVTSVFSLYTTKITSYNLLYGSLASLVMAMIWFILMAWVLCIGLMFNKVLKETQGRTYI